MINFALYSSRAVYSKAWNYIENGGEGRREQDGAYECARKLVINHMFYFMSKLKILFCCVVSVDGWRQRISIEGSESGSGDGKKKERKCGE